MRLMVTGHREEKLSAYNTAWIRGAIEEVVYLAAESGFTQGMAGMASGVDLWFCRACLDVSLPFVAYVPFEGQEQYMTDEAAMERKELLDLASQIVRTRNRSMVKRCEAALVVWDGNKGGTHNCFQQLLELKKRVWWAIPQKERIVEV